MRPPSCLGVVFCAPRCTRRPHLLLCSPLPQTPGFLFVSFVLFPQQGRHGLACVSLPPTFLESECRHYFGPVTALGENGSACSGGLGRVTSPRAARPAFGVVRPKGPRRASGVEAHPCSLGEVSPREASRWAGRLCSPEAPARCNRGAPIGAAVARPQGAEGCHLGTVDSSRPLPAAPAPWRPHGEQRPVPPRSPGRPRPAGVCCCPCVPECPGADARPRPWALVSLCPWGSRLQAPGRFPAPKGWRLGGEPTTERGPEVRGSRGSPPRPSRLCGERRRPPAAETAEAGAPRGRERRGGIRPRGRGRGRSPEAPPRPRRGCAQAHSARASRRRARIPDPLPQRRRRRRLPAACVSAPAPSSRSGPAAAPAARAEPRAARCHAAPAAALKDGDAGAPALPAPPAAAAAAALRPGPRRGPARGLRRPPG